MGAIVAVMSAFEEVNESQRGAFAVGAIAVFCGLLIVMQFVGPNIDIRKGEISFSLLLLRRRIPLSEVQSYEVRTYQPLNNPDPAVAYMPVRLFVGSRLITYVLAGRMSEDRFRSATNPYRRQMWVAPTHCVELTLTNGTHVLIPTQHPAALLHALHMAKGAQA
jgi:hypothetical protein